MELIMLLAIAPFAIYYVNKLCTSRAARLAEAQLLVTLADGIDTEKVTAAKELADTLK